MSEIALKVGSMHGTIKNLLIKSMQRFGLDLVALDTVQTPLAQAFRTDWHQGIDQQVYDVPRSTNAQLENGLGSTGLDTLAAAASQQELCDDRRLREKRQEPRQNLLSNEVLDSDFANREGPEVTPYENATGMMGMSQELQLRTGLGAEWPLGTDSWTPIAVQNPSFNGVSPVPIGYEEAEMPMGSPSASLLDNAGHFLTDEWRMFLMGGFQN